ncbi:dihydropteroate synthase [Helicobacter sp. 11S02596-1]|uniref:dihydropteroate synthase n=1 Tax=Helicobacter sp. 11S02596-1 TaxID=1476194 RepID=UPI000BA64928|nr:dihydropteroate synthase [Helicobacter sp. 11S02596-1]PAF41504.1 dihydropteroate synthase [Helicobacter sp. 11S02596-1]
MFIKRIHPDTLSRAIENIGSEKQGQKIMNKKGEVIIFEIKNLPLSAMMILKQEALSVGGDLATPKDGILAKKSHYDGVLIATKSQLERIVSKCKIQPFGLKELADQVASHLKIAPQSLDFPQIMAIVNITPDSFFSGSRCDGKRAIERIYQLMEKGVGFIDIGAASSKPGSDLIDFREEKQRLNDVANEIYTQNLFKKALFSIDTYNPQTADFALAKGFGVVNDISGYHHSDMAKITAQYNATAVLMHSKGTPKVMQKLTDYADLFGEIDNFFEQKIQWLQSFGIKNIILDIGFGFAKNQEQNLALIKHLKHFLHFGRPILVGASRKNTIGLLTQRDTQDRLAGTLALHFFALQNGANILRVHDEDEHLDILKIYEALEAVK